ncbi:hypothetical protein MPH_07448 [Macrophomina phaseolina MS6]|uniref:Fatty acid desaturase type 1 n=1 Tax=Macrophomina phaseolina (strain MS6) TaxID=1126212 RepID=K2RRN4_MACPH|nr:hypothetical protein MPH_07448 [Macrophomina phaseolina MS6]
MAAVLAANMHVAAFFVAVAAATVLVARSPVACRILDAMLNVSLTAFMWRHSTHEIHHRLGNRIPDSLLSEHCGRTKPQRPRLQIPQWADERQVPAWEGNVLHVEREVRQHLQNLERIDSRSVSSAPA